MRSNILGFVLCASCVLAAAQEGLRRTPRSSGSSSSSYSSSSSSSSGGSGHVPTGFFQFPTQMPFFPFASPSPMNFPMFDFNQMFQQFLGAAQAAHSFAAQNPAYAKIFQEQMQILATQQQMALAQYPFAFPGIDSNAISPDNYNAGGGAGVYGAAPSGGYGTGGSSSSSHSGSTGGGYDGFGGSPGGYGAGVGSVPSGGYGGGLRTGSEPAVATSGMVSVGPSGGFGTASSFPGGPDGLGVRIAEEFPAPSGGNFGTFSSSSSGVSSVNGKTTSFKTSTVGVNDNGKITFRTVNE